MSEIDLLCQAIQSQDSVENNGIKFLYMDENTIYRFQNNKMKPISKTLLNKAKKLIQQQQASTSSTSSKPKRGKGKKNVQQQQEMNDPDDEANDENENMNESEDEDEMVMTPSPKQANKPSKQANKPIKQPKQPKSDMTTYGNINLDEYYNNKNRMEYMSREMDRLNQKITKLKQYKHLVNKITGGGEIDDLPSNPSYEEQPTHTRISTSRQINDSLFI